MSPSSPVRAIIYDCGNTLVYAHPTLAEVCEMVAERHGHHIDAAAFEAALPHWHEMYYRGIGTMYVSDEGVRSGWARYYAAALGGLLDMPEDEIVELGGAIYDWFSHPERWTPFPEVAETLAEGKRRGFVQGVLSDWGSDLLGILDGHRLTADLDFVVASAVVGVAKPGRDIFDRALARAGVAPHEALYVGDSYVADVLGARAAGLRAVLIDRDGHAPPVDCVVIRDLRDVFAVAANGA